MLNLASHPCFGTTCGNPNTGRIHLPVAPTCNIFCRFCSRGQNPVLQRPGVTQKILSPTEALGVMDLALRLCPDIKVAGVAGPGDPLASEEALDTLSLIKQYHPELMACLSTNGLELAAQMERLLWVGVQTITVTVNAVDPKILIHLNRGIIKDGKFCGGKLGAITLIEAQERGIRMAKQNSMLVKINFVLVPGLNEWHIAEVAQKTQEWGADLLNIIPLIPASDLADYPAPTLPQLENAIQTAKKFLPVKRNCRHCRADACGIPGGQDFSPEIYGNLPQAETFSHG